MIVDESWRKLSWEPTLNNSHPRLARGVTQDASRTLWFHSLNANFKTANSKKFYQRFPCQELVTSYMARAHVCVWRNCWEGLRSRKFNCICSPFFACFIMGILERIAEIESEVCIFRSVYKPSFKWVLDAGYFDWLQMARTQKNKATAHHLGLLKARLAKLRRELITPKGGGAVTGEG